MTENGSDKLLLDSVHENMLSGLGQLSDYFGFGKVVGQIYGAMLMSDRPLCLDDLVERLDISKANASINMHTLESMGMARQVWVRGSGGRRKFYTAETDFWQIITNILKGREMRDVDRAIGVMDDNISRLTADLASMNEQDKELAQLYLERIKQIQSLFQFAQVIFVTVLTRTAELEQGEIPRIEIG
jgi:DNA-binding transcriptional regulator GbsR (MarR family)